MASALLAFVTCFVVLDLDDRRYNTCCSIRVLTQRYFTTTCGIYCEYYFTTTCTCPWTCTYLHLYVLTWYKYTVLRTGNLA